MRAVRKESTAMRVPRFWPSALMNLASSSPWERFGWAPFTVLLAVAAFVAARGRSTSEDAVSVHG